MIPAPFPPPMIQTTIPVISLNEAVEQVMQDFDSEDPALPLRDPAVPRADRPSLKWLRSAALSELPDNPFRKGTASYSEAEALLLLLKADRDQAGTIESLLHRLEVHEPGTALALWRWARRQERIRPWSPVLRRIWEDKLMARSVPAMLNGYAMRHGLCWALAEKDESRFAELKAAWGQDAPSLFASIQGLFGWLGGMSPVLRLWTLPGLEYQDRRLDSLLAVDGGKTTRIWISPDVDWSMKMPAHTTLIIPSATGAQNSNDTGLIQLEQSAGTTISMSLSMAKGQAYFAPSRADFEALGLMFFPILIELDTKGAIKDIRMGDAAPPRP